jgi:hypothetical protein
LLRKPEERTPLRRIYLDGRVILKWILDIYDGRVWTGFIWLRIGTGGCIL